MKSKFKCKFKCKGAVEVTSIIILVAIVTVVTIWIMNKSATSVMNANQKAQQAIQLTP